LYINLLFLKRKIKEKEYDIMENLKYVLEMENITKEFPGVKALDNVQLKLKPGTVHALMGENGAGKSTLMKCLFGIYEKDNGKILLDGVEVNFKSTKEALENGVSMVHQELNQVLQRNVLDNIWLGRYPMKGFFVDEKKMYEDTINIFKDLDIKVDPRKKVADLPIAERQMIEIAKAVSYKSKVIVMDEPTSSLTEKEVDHLFRIINRLKESGVAIVYISHKMEEIKMISDEITILRDGKWISTNDVSKISTEQIISMMVGRDLTERFPKKDNTVKEMILEVKNLTALNQPSIQDVSFELYKGEILGIAGLVGSKRTEIVETIFGIRPKEKGEIILNGKTVKNKNPEDAIKNGFALVTEERRSTGIFSMLDIAFNSVISNLDRYKNKFRLLKNKDMEKDTKWIVDSMRVKTPSYTTKIGSLSGGNQQKVIIGRWLLTEPEVLMLDEPTRGIDVLAKFEIYQLMIDLAKKDKGIIMISSEMPELLGVTDRILVMSNGRVAGIVKTSETNQEEIMELSAKYL
jgi:galactose/methyl galactoside ABC transporter, ATP-binding protein MglA